MIRPIKIHKGAQVLRQNSLQALVACSVLALQVVFITDIQGEKNTSHV